jgi:hypothetical protein
VIVGEGALAARRAFTPSTKYCRAISADQKRRLVDPQLITDKVAHFLAVLVDGYLFQRSQEQVHAQYSTKQHLKYLEYLLNTAMHGLQPAMRRRS